MKKHTFLAWISIVALMLLWAGCGAAPQGTNISVSDVGSVEGTVTDVSTGNPLSGVTVQIGDKTDVTGDNGVYSIQDIDVGSRTITATKTGYQSYNGTVTVSKGTTVSHDIEMTTTGTTPDTTPPTVSSTSPASSATGVAVSSSISVTFSEAMDCSTITISSFTLKDSSNNAAAGTITTCSNTSAVFTPSSNLSYSTSYTATITSGVKDAAGNALASNYSWSFTTASAGGGATSGSLDTTFGSGGKVTTSVGSDDTAYAVDFQSDGKIVVAGHSYNGSNYDFAVVRYNTTGTLDTTFGPSGKVTTSFGTNKADWATALAIQSDAKIIVAGHTTNSDGTSGDIALVRLNSDGSIDTSFGTAGKVTTDISSGNHDTVRAVAIQSDGKIVVSGFSSNSGFAVVRYNTDGSLDSTFGTSGKVTTSFGSGTAVGFSLRIQADAKIVVSGGFYDGTNYGFAVARYDTSGTLDTTFGTGGKATTVISNPTGNEVDYTTDLKIQSDGKIVVAGHSATGVSYAGTDFVLVRYNADGSMDSTFGTGGKVLTDIGTNYEKAIALAIQSDGKIIAAGLSNGPTSFVSTLVRYNTDGSLDTTFDADGKLTTSIGSSFDGFMDVGIQADGKIVAVGAAVNNGSTAVFSLARYWP